MAASETNTLTSRNNFPSAPENSSELIPSEARNIFRLGEYYGTSAGFCRGYMQANLAVVPDSDADDFEEFCRRNAAPLPLLYRSKTGEVGAPTLAKDTDVRSDIPRYLIFSHGRQVDDMRDLLGFDWTNKVSFYLGCSFTFEQALINNGIDLEYVKKCSDVPMYLTNISCSNVNDKFDSVRMAVSMRPVKERLLQIAVEVTAQYPQAHGAPIHIGDPTRIGVTSLSNVDFGNPLKETTDIGEGEVPVFWACGVTGTQVMKALKSDLSFTHYPSSMFITDKLVSPCALPTDKERPRVIPISPRRFPYFASLLSIKTLGLLQQLEELIMYDPNECHISDLKMEGDFVKSLLTLSHCQSVGVVFGFPCNVDYECLEETDGPPGALTIGKALRYLGKKVAIISEERNRHIVESTLQLMLDNDTLMSAGIEFRSCDQVIATNAEGLDCIVAIERMGSAKDGCHYTMKGIDLTSHLELIDQVFVNASQNSSVVTIGIGDRGNELGLGRVQDKARKHIGDLACDVTSDYVIMAGVSNWAGFAIATGLYLLSTCPVHMRYLNHGITEGSAGGTNNTGVTLNGFVQTDENVFAVLKHLNSLGLRDGISKSIEQSVDNVPLEKHLEIIGKMREIASQY